VTGAMPGGLVAVDGSVPGRDFRSGLGRSGGLRGRYSWLSAPTGGWHAAATGGQRRRGKADPVVFIQVDDHVACCGGAVCKTVGSAYVGSNPTPATTCENGPLAANSRAGGPFLLRPMMCHLVAL
jgi:hypothetical protein